MSIFKYFQFKSKEQTVNESERSYKIIGDGIAELDISSLRHNQELRDQINLVSAQLNEIFKGKTEVRPPSSKVEND